MCGIAGYKAFGKHRPTLTELRELILAIESRGGDATGGAWLNEKNKLHVIKGAVKSPDFVKYKTFLGLGTKIPMPKQAVFHTRRKTKGDQKNNLNNHPIHVRDAGIALVHNGSISNDDEIFADLKLPRQAEVDSEILARLMQRGADEADELYDNYNNGLKMIEDKCYGSAAFAMLHEKYPEHLFLARSNNPIELLLDKERDILFFASSSVAVKKGNENLEKKKLWRGFELSVYSYGTQPTMKVDTAMLLGPRGIEETFDFDLAYTKPASTHNYYSGGGYRGYTTPYERREEKKEFDALTAIRNKRLAWVGFNNGKKIDVCPFCRTANKTLKKLPKKKHKGIYTCIECYASDLYKTALPKTGQEKCERCDQEFLESSLMQWPVGNFSVIERLDYLCPTCYEQVCKPVNACAKCGDWKKPVGKIHYVHHNGFLCKTCEEDEWQAP